MFPNLFTRSPALDLDPERAQQIYARFDDQQGYRTYEQHCQEKFSGTLDSAPSLLTKQGLEHLHILSTGDAKTLLTQSLVLADTSFTNKPEIDYSDILIIRDKTFLKMWFEKIFQPMLTAKLTNYFQSHFLIYWYTFLKAKPADKAVRSFLWHCDKGPSTHLKILLYLNDMLEHRGNTLFLDRATTALFAKNGYVFGSVNKRTDDLTELARQYGIPFHPLSWEMNAGEGVVFEPSQILHKGILPSAGFRYVLALCLLPSPIPWDVAFQKNHHEGFSSDYTWHSHAQDLMKAIMVPG